MIGDKTQHPGLEGEQSDYCDTSRFTGRKNQLKILKRLGFPRLAKCLEQQSSVLIGKYFLDRFSKKALASQYMLTGNREETIFVDSIGVPSKKFMREKEGLIGSKNLTEKNFPCGFGPPNYRHETLPGFHLPGRDCRVKTLMNQGKIPSRA
jgi:hypothetical protein